MIAEILVLVFLATIAPGALAKHPKRQRRYNLRMVRVSAELALGTLATDTALTVQLGAVAVNSYRFMSIKATWTLSSFTAGEGPITVGYAHSDYSVTEIKECLEASNSIDPGLKIEQEQANRLVRIVGTLKGEANTSLNDGRPIKTKLNWLISPGDRVNLFAFNEDTAANLTTGSLLNCQGQFWVKDSA